MKKNDLIIVIPFLIFIFTFGLLYFFVPDIEFSENENKYLQQLPKVSLKSLLNGTFESDFEEYLSDQIAGRDFWVQCNTVLLLSSGQKDVNGVYVGDNGYLLEIFDNIDMDRYEKQIAALNKFSTYVDVPVYFTIAPNSVSVLSDYLPEFAVNYSQDKYISDFYNGLSSDITTINISDVLKAHSDEYIFYKTDHHWTTYGSYLAFNEIISVMGFEQLSKADLIKTEVSDDFKGTFYSKGNFNVEADVISRYDMKDAGSITVTLDDGTTRSSLYEESSLDKKDKYGYFSHGNPAHLKVETSVENGKTLVIIKDSYMHCMVPFFTSYYSEIHMLDPRYIKTNLTEYILGLEPNEILILYNAKTLSDDVNFTRLGTEPK